MREFLAIYLKREGHTVRDADGARAAQALLDKGPAFDLVITDLRMPGPTDHGAIQNTTFRGATGEDVRIRDRTQYVSLLPGRNQEPEISFSSPK